MNTKRLIRKSHFLGTKIRNLRKRNRLTMDDLSARCIKVNAELAPSVSYLSMIERGKRVPSEDVLGVIAAVFHKDVAWFLDDVPEEDNITPIKTRGGGLSGMALEPGFLFSSEILQIAIPELLAQSGTSGRQFAHLLIRAYQEHHRNHFPDLERAAEEVGLKRLPLNVEDLLDITKKLGLKIQWFRRAPEAIADEAGASANTLVRSWFEAPGTIHLNEALKKQTTRLKYDLAVHIGHCILHDRDGIKSVLMAGRSQGLTLQQNQVQVARSSNVEALDILSAWRDFECSFFAGALLCPKVPFRQLLDRQGYEIGVHGLIDVSPAVAMRRMTAVSPYPHWHYFDAFAPGTLKAVYRGNGIPLPWGNMRSVDDPCQHWSVFRMLNTTGNANAAQISVLDTDNGPRIYCCESLKTEDMAGNSHVLCAGIDLTPALDTQGASGFEVASQLKAACVQQGGSAPIPAAIRQQLTSVAKILNIHWVERGIELPARVICSRGGVCPREPSCYSSKDVT